MRYEYTTIIFQIQINYEVDFCALPGSMALFLLILVPMSQICRIFVAVHTLHGTQNYFFTTEGE